MYFDNCNRKMPKLYSSTFVMKNIQNILLLNGEINRSSYCKKKLSLQMGKYIIEVIDMQIAKREQKYSCSCCHYKWKETGKVKEKFDTS